MSTTENAFETAAASYTDALDTPELEVPAADPEAHRGKINGITAEQFETGSVGIKIHLESFHNALETDYTIFPPMAWVENINIDPSEISTDVPDGKKQSPRQRYGQVVSNTDKNAELQRLRQIAYEQGRTLEGVPKPTDFEEYVSLLNQLLINCECVFTRKADENADDPAYAKRLKTNAVYPPSIATKPKSLKKFRKLWEE